ncbi:hypothetical protein Q0O04_14820, partial [Rossellomorea marisflavi]
TRKLSSSAPMVVGGSPPVRVGRRQAIERKAAHLMGCFFCGVFLLNGKNEIGMRRSYQYRGIENGRGTSLLSEGRKGLLSH